MNGSASPRGVAPPPREGPVCRLTDVTRIRESTIAARRVPFRLSAHGDLARPASMESVTHARLRSERGQPRTPIACAVCRSPSVTRPSPSPVPVAARYRRQLEGRRGAAVVGAREIYVRAVHVGGELRANSEESAARSMGEAREQPTSRAAPRPANPTIQSAEGRPPDRSRAAHSRRERARGRTQAAASNDALNAIL